MSGSKILVNLLCGDFKADEKKKFFASLLYNVKLLQEHYVQHMATINMMLLKHPGGTNNRLLRIGSDLIKMDSYITVAIETFDAIHNTNEFTKWLNDYSGKKKIYMQLIPELIVSPEDSSLKLDITKQKYNDVFYLLEILKKSLLKCLKNEHEIIKKSRLILDINKITNSTKSRFVKLFDDLLRALLPISATAVAITLAFIANFYKMPRIIDGGINIFTCFSKTLGICLLVFLFNLLMVIFFSIIDGRHMKKFHSNKMTSEILSTKLLKNSFYKDIAGTALVFLILLAIGYFINGLVNFYFLAKTISYYALK